VPAKEVHNLGEKKTKGQSRKENQWPPLSKDQGQPMVEIPTKMVNKEKRVDNQLSKKGKKRNYPFDDDDVQGIFDEIMAAKAISLPEPKRLVEVNKTNDPRYFPYHRIISHPINNSYVFKDIIEDMIKRGEIEIKGTPPKGPTASSNTTSMIEQKDDSSLSSSETN